MAIDFEALDPAFKEKAQVLLERLTERGLSLTPYSGIRTLSEQARLYRRSRSTDTITAKIDWLRTMECDYLADIMEEVGPQPQGVWATNAMPGQSYHAFGLAMDVLIHPSEMSSYKTYADEAINLGLTAGYYFKLFQDGGHVQLGSTSVPHGYTLKQCNDYFRERGMK